MEDRQGNPDPVNDMNFRIFLLSLLLASCASPHVELYSLDPSIPETASAPLLPLAIHVGRPKADPGYETPEMAYTTKPHEIRYFLRNRWVASPSRMLKPVLEQALSKKFSRIAPTPSSADLELDTEIVMLRQEFSGHSSRIHLVVRAQVGEGKARKFDILEPCPGNDPYGGVIAANRAIARLSAEITQYCEEYVYLRRGRGS